MEILKGRIYGTVDISFLGMQFLSSVSVDVKNVADLSELLKQEKG